MAEQIFVLDDFSGGWNYKSGNKNVAPNEGTVFLNVISMPRNYLRTRRGCRRVTSEKVPKGKHVVSFDQVWFSNGNTYLIVTSGADPDSPDVNERQAGVFLLDWHAGDFTEITGQNTTWTTPTHGTVFVEIYFDTVVIVNGIDLPLVWEETWNGCKQFGVDYQIDGVVVIPKICKTYNQFLFFMNTMEGNEHYPYRIRWCEPGQLNVWPEENFIDVWPNDGDIIVSAEIIGDALAIFKERKIFVLVPGGTEFPFVVRLVVDGRGLIAPHGIAAAYNDLIFMAEDGIYIFDGTTTIEEISDSIKEFIIELNPARRSITVAAPHEEIDQIWFAVPYGPSENNTHIIIYSYTGETKQGPWFLYSRPVATLGYYRNIGELRWYHLTEPIDNYTMSFDERFLLDNYSLLVSGGYDGHIYEEGVGATDAGQPIIGEWASKYFDFGLPYLNKRIKRIILWVRNSPNTYIWFRVYVDYDETNYLEVKVPCWDETKIKEGLIEVRIDLIAIGREFKFGVVSDEQSYGWELHKIMAIYDVKGRTKQEIPFVQ